MAEFLRPSADVSIGDWTTDDDSTSNLYAELDESSADSADYIKSGPGPDPDAYKSELTNPTGNLTDATFRIRFRKDGTDTVSLTARLLQDNYPTTWNTADKTSNITLSGNDRTATLTDNVEAGVRSIASFSSGKKYCEITFTNKVGLNWLVGLATSSYTLANANLGYSGTSSVGYVEDGEVRLNSSLLETIASYTEPNTVCIASDFDDELVWFRVDGGDWNDSPTADPATGTEGLDISGLAAGPYFIAIASAGASGSVIDLNTGASDYAQTPPSGFDNWGVETEIASWEYEDIADTDTDEEETLTAPQIAAITDPDALRIELEANWSALLALYDVVGGMWLPAPWVCQPPNIQAATFVMDATGEIVALVFRAPKTGNIDRFDFQVSVTNSPDNGLRASFQTVDGSTGLPTGTLLGATNNAFVTYAHTVTTGWKSTNFGEVVSVTRGDLLAAVIDYPSFVASDNVTVWRVGVGAQRVAVFPYAISATSTKELTYVPNMAIHYTDGYVPLAPFYPGGANTTTTITFASNTAVADEWGMAFSVPGPCKLNAVQINMTTAAGGNFDVVVYDTDGTTELATLNFDADVTVTGQEGQVTAFLQNEVTLTQDGVYRVTVRPTTTTNVVLRYWAFASLDLMDTIEGGSSLYMTSQVDDGGTWTNYNSGTFRRPAMSVQLSAITGS